MDVHIFYAELAEIICYFPDVSGPPKRLIRDPASSHHDRLRQLGIAVLIAGMVAAGTVYWFGTRPRDLSDDPAMIGFNKPQTRQMGMLYGQMGVMMDDLVAALKRPGVQATLIVAICAVFSLVCFHLARPPQLEEPGVASTRGKS